MPTIAILLLAAVASAIIAPAETSRPVVLLKERTILIGELSAGARQPFSVVAAETIAARCKLVVGDRGAVEMDGRELAGRWELVVPPGEYRVRSTVAGSIRPRR